MKTITTVTYKCEKCGGTYSTEERALECEATSIRRDKGVQIGDIVTITLGDGVGKKAKVTRVGTLSPNEANHYKKYVHTVCLTADIIDGWGTRTLMWDTYVV